MKHIPALLLSIALCGSLFAQEAATTSVGTVTSGPAKVHSPELLPDGRVTFRILAPKATAVMVEGNWSGGRDVPMTKDDAGLWSVTTSPLPSELWAYGNSRGDLTMLRAADRGVNVGRLGRWGRLRSFPGLAGTPEWMPG